MLRYTRSHFQLPFETAPVLVFAIFLAHFFPFIYVFVFILLAESLGNIPTGFSPLTPLWVLKMSILAGLSTFLPFNLILVGLMIIPLDFLVTFGIKSWMQQNPEEMLPEIAVVVVNLVALLTIGRLLV